MTKKSELRGMIEDLNERLEFSQDCLAASSANEFLFAARINELMRERYEADKEIVELTAKNSRLTEESIKLNEEISQSYRDGYSDGSEDGFHKGFASAMDTDS